MIKVYTKDEAEAADLVVAEDGWDYDVANLDEVLLGNEYQERSLCLDDGRLYELET